MSRRAILLAVRDQLRAAIPLGAALPTNSCEVMLDGRPTPRAGKWFYAVHRGPRKSTALESLDETYGCYVTISVRVTEPDDRIGPALFVAALAKGLALAADAVRALLHMNYDVMNAANAYLFTDYQAAGGIGTVYGFSEPLGFEADGAPEPVGPDWFMVDPMESTPAILGYSQRLQFGGARRMQNLAAIF